MGKRFFVRRFVPGDGLAGNQMGKFVEKYPINAIGYTNLKIELYKGVVAEIRVHVSEDK